ncbi:MAG: sigma-70 family RNA polymerase sigma factor [Oscillospiraceae bacterium]|nr:sigma-70 family RNA polymerase sigma factor [Oscillospiraceae bacterium]
MPKSLLRTDKEIAEIYQRHVQAVYRLCFAYMKNPADAEDAVSDTFYRMIKSGPVFDSEKHEEAWLMRTAGNLCKNNLKHWWRRNENWEDHAHLRDNADAGTDSTLEAVMALPDKYKAVVYLFYYARYSGEEIAAILRKPQSTVRSHLREARSILKRKLGGEFDA